MRYSLKTLLILMTVMPPAIAFVWFAWGLLLTLGAIALLLALWIFVSYALARLCGEFMGSTMG